MLLSTPEFTEKSEYGFAVARVRALETKLIDSTGMGQLISAPEDRFYALLSELSGIDIKEEDTVSEVLDKIEWRLTQTYYLVKDLIIEDEYKRLISIGYDYELLKLILKEKRGNFTGSYKHTSLRSNYTYPVMKSLIEAGSFLDLGPGISEAFRSVEGARELTGGQIDIICDRIYYIEIFEILNDHPNEFIEGYYRRKIDIANFITALRLKLQGKKRSAINQSFIEGGSIGIEHFEDGFDLNIDAFIQSMAFSWFSSVTGAIPKGQGDDESAIALIERALDEHLLRYVKESMYVTFGIEPVISYLWKVESETKNLRLIVLSRYSGVPAAEIKTNVRGLNE